MVVDGLLLHFCGYEMITWIYQHGAFKRNSTSLTDLKRFLSVVQYRNTITGEEGVVAVLCRNSPM